MERTETIIHIISHQDAQKCYDMVEEFKAGRPGDEITEAWSSTVFPINQHGASIIIPSVVLKWKCSKEQAVSFRNQQKLMFKGN